LSKYASGKYAYGISDRSGFRYRLRDMRQEWNGLLVGKDEFEEKHPQLFPIRVRPDGQALRKARPEITLDQERIIQYGFNPVGFSDPLNLFDINNLVANGLVGSVTIGGDATSIDTETDTDTDADSLPTATLTGFGIAASVGTVTISTSSELAATYTVTVVGGNPSNHPYYNFGSSNKFAINGSTATADVNLSLNEGSTYRFDQSDSSNIGHPLRFSTTANGTHGGGSEYTTGVTTNGTPGYAGAYTQIEIASGAPTLYYYCTNHSGMGAQINT
tara:strand:+ start:855 stop:1676 length:822 start_codon:yes stop_codon:yes gene_type:complete